MSTIHLNVELEYSELLRVADMLQRMAKALDPAPEVTEQGGDALPNVTLAECFAPDVGAIGSAGPSASAMPENWLECTGAALSRAAWPELFAVIGTSYGEGDGVTTFNLPKLPNEFIRGASGTAPAPDAAAVFGGGPAAPDTTEPDDATTETSDVVVSPVDLDSEGLPWDERIHGGKRDKLAKTQAWKKRRCPKELDAHSWAAKVVEVEAELRAAMAAGKPPETVTPAGPASPASPTKPAAPAAPTKTDTPDPEAMTFGQFLNATTTAGIDKATVTAACVKQGLPGLPLLATRPDLIPAVMAELFPGL